MVPWDVNISVNTIIESGVKQIHYNIISNKVTPCNRMFHWVILNHFNVFHKDYKENKDNWFTSPRVHYSAGSLLRSIGHNAFEHGVHSSIVIFRNSVKSCDLNMCLFKGKVLVYNYDTVIRPKVWRTDLRIITSIVSLITLPFVYATLIIWIIGELSQ